MRTAVAALLELATRVLDRLAIYVAGRMAERSAQNERAAEIQAEQLRAASDRPRDRDDLRDRLRSGRF